MEAHMEKQHEMVEMLAIVMDWEQGDASLHHEMEDPELEESFETLYLESV